MAGGFWETLNQNFAGTMDTYEQQKQQKRLRALQKLKFMMDSGDVGTAVSPDVEKDVQDYAPEGAGLIQNGAYVGSPEQQREGKFRQYIEQNPEASSDDIMTRGIASGAVSPAAYVSHNNTKERLAQGAELSRERMDNQRTMQEDRQQQQLMLQGIIQAGMRDRAATAQGSPDELFQNKTQRQKWATNRKTYLPQGGPYNYFTQKLLNDPATALAELRTVDGQEDSADIDSKDSWERYLGHIMQNQDEMRDMYGMKPNELEALLSHIQRIANKRKK